MRRRSINSLIRNSLNQVAKQFFILAHELSRQRAASAVLAAPEGFIVEIKEQTRTLEQNAKLHAMLQDISRQIDYMGKRRGVEFWKGLFVSGWQMATGQNPEIVPGLEGEFINIRESTATMGVRKISSLIEYIYPWAIEHNVRFSKEAIYE